jgi:hypothetical protein
MTPYELRFEIFKEAQNLANNQYHTRWAYVDRKLEIDSTYPEDYPSYPSFDHIQKIAEDINKFVSCN